MAATSRASIDRMVSAGVLPSVTLHRGKKKRTYRIRASDIEKVFGIPLKDIETFVAQQDRQAQEAKRTRGVNGNGAAVAEAKRWTTS